MAPGDAVPTPQQPTKSTNTPAPAPQAPSPPSKRDLASWWKQFKRNTKKGEETGPQTSSIFSVPLNVSIKYANVAISLTGDDGQRFIYGYVPIVVAKCGVFLKEKATDVEGIFRLSGSAKRIKDLQEIFDSPDRFGKGLDWTGYTVHDAANIFRRYLNLLPEPIVPLEFYERFRDPLRSLRVSATEPQVETSKEQPPFNHDETVATYQQLIKELPPLNRQLLLYILDLLTVFAAKSDVNRMTASNLSAIFQPGLLSHPDHSMSPEEYKLSQDVLVFLIDNQDNFLFGMTGTAADAQTVKDVQGGLSPQPGISNLRRSASNASGGADSLRKYEAALRRNASVSSKHSKNSTGNPASPTTPTTLRSPTLGMHRSNTVPSKRPSGLSPNLYQANDGTASPSGKATPHRQSLQTSRSPSQTPPLTPSLNKNAKGSGPSEGLQFNSTNPDSTPSSGAPQSDSKNTFDEDPQGLTPTMAIPKGGATTPSKERKLTSLFGLASPPDDGRQPNRLKKKRRVPHSASESAQSSTHSLQTGSEDATLGTSTSQSGLGQPDSVGNQSYTSTPRVMEPTTDEDKESQAPRVSDVAVAKQPHGERPGKSDRSQSRPSSVRSRSSATDLSDADRLDDPNKVENKEKRRSWIFARSSKQNRDQTPGSISSNARAEVSHSSFGSATLSQEYVSNEPHRNNKDWPASGGSALVSQESDLSSVSQPPSVTSPKDNNGENERKGFFGKFKAKVAQVKDGVKDRDGDRERAKSPPHASDQRPAGGLEQPTSVTPASPPSAPTTTTSSSSAPGPGFTTEENAAAEKTSNTPPCNSEAGSTVLTTVEENAPLTLPATPDTVVTTTVQTEAPATAPASVPVSVADEPENQTSKPAAVT